ncbi:hypothetical protein E3O65_09635 [Cryobacterium breve]|uniref:Transposase DDE domain-containing protein n=1 Tax=Cryobacterium breve TaxID=1259258 RepID=A0ABY2IZB2_9MICO|nr:hypothetical protein [Cryobacterium breve]TFC97970.1 hypothetical protein E3O65_09635 [Cryobacterium breve]
MLRAAVPTGAAARRDRKTTSQMIPMVTAMLQPIVRVVASHSGIPVDGACHHRLRVYEAKLRATSAMIPIMAGSKTPRTACSACIRPVASARSATPPQTPATQWSVPRTIPVVRIAAKKSPPGSAGPGPVRDGVVWLLDASIILPVCSRCTTPTIPPGNAGPGRAGHCDGCPGPGG